MCVGVNATRYDRPPRRVDHPNPFPRFQVRPNLPGCFKCSGKFSLLILLGLCCCPHDDDDDVDGNDYDDT